jgi:predicted phosphodiesterase
VIIALLADIHSNFEALQACLRHAADNGAERYAFLGDLVGYGADPQNVIARVADYAARGAIVVKGNHDEAIGKGTRDLNDLARESIEWTSRVLSPDEKSFLALLPMTVRHDSTFFVHGSALEPGRWEYIDSNTAARLESSTSRRFGRGCRRSSCAASSDAGVPIPVRGAHGVRSPLSGTGGPQGARDEIAPDDVSQSCPTIPQCASRARKETAPSQRSGEPLARSSWWRSILRMRMTSGTWRSSAPRSRFSR